MQRNLPTLLFLLLLMTACVMTVHAQDILGLDTADAQSEGIVDNLPNQVEVIPEAEDSEISDRLMGIMQATKWFEGASVRVDRGVVFIEGMVDEEWQRDWIGKLAGNTEGVVAVVNSVEIREKPFLDFSDSIAEIQGLVKSFFQSLPLIILSLLILLLTWLFARWFAGFANVFLGSRVKSQILRGVIVKALAVLIFILGIYLVLRISGLTRLAVTLLGGTGLFGLIIGFAFRDIAENFLASILISVQRPFAMGDVVEVDGKLGILQSVNSRSTLMMTFDGNHVQIPNATIYKGVIINYSANPNARFDFVVGIGYADLITEAQEIAMKVLHDHTAVLDDPEPMVLVDQLGAATVNLKFFFWVDVAKHNGLKVKSSVIRLVKVALIEAGISMPDEAREVIFPDGIPVSMIENKSEAKPLAEKPVLQKPAQPVPDAEKAQIAEGEGDLANDDHEIQKQADAARNPEGGENILGPS